MTGELISVLLARPSVKPIKKRPSTTLPLPPRSENSVGGNWFRERSKTADYICALYKRVLRSCDSPRWRTSVPWQPWRLRHSQKETSKRRLYESRSFFALLAAPVLTPAIGGRKGAAGLKRPDGGHPMTQTRACGERRLGETRIGRDKS